MKRISSLIAAFLMLLPSFAAPVLVYAEITTTDTTTTESSSETETEAAKTARDTRVEAYKKALTTKLTETVKTRLASRCEAAQALVKIAKTRNDAAVKTRSTAYDNIVKALEATATRLAAEGLDVTTLSSNITELKTKVADFKTAAEASKQSLADVADLDCKTDPTAFKAALETARKDRAAVLTSAQDIRTFLAGTVKATLKALKEKSDNGTIKVEQ